MGTPGVARPSRGLVRGVAAACVLASCVPGCTSLLGIDGNYVAESIAPGSGGVHGHTGGAGGSSTADSGQGGTAGGSAEAGTSAGGTGGASQGGAAGACEDAAACGAGLKCCNGACVRPSPLTGCLPTDCTPCPQSLPHTDPLCVEGQCSARCSDGYVPYGGACVLQSSLDGGATGGAGGGGGGTGGGGAGGQNGGGTGGFCYPPACPLCTDPLVGIAQCCSTTTSQCGCTWFGPAYCR